MSQYDGDIGDHRTWKHIGIGDFVIVQRDWQSWRPRPGDHLVSVYLPQGITLQVVDLGLLKDPTFRLATGVTLTIPSTQGLKIRRATPLEAQIGRAHV